jgi:hypothetical protein
MSRTCVTTLAALLVGVGLAASAIASVEVTYTPTLGGQVVPSGNPQDHVFFGNVEEVAMSEEEYDDGEDGEVAVQASCGGRLSKPGGGKRSPRGSSRAKDMAEDNYRQARRYGDEVHKDTRDSCILSLIDLY